MVTIFVAAEKFVYWNDRGQLAVDMSLVNELSGHGQDMRVVVYFAPDRFGFWYDDMREVEEAWAYLENALKASGFAPDNVIMFGHDVECDKFVEFLAPNSKTYVLSGDSRDESLAVRLGGRRVTVLPDQCVGFWQKLSIRRGLRTLFAALNA